MNYNYSTNSNISGGNFYFDLIHIQSGADVSFSNVDMIAKPNARIIIEKGARLVLNNCRIAPSIVNNNYNLNSFSTWWFGIEVYGSRYTLQALNPNGTSLVQGVLEINNSCISGARCGITAGNRINGSLNFVPDFGGGVIKATNTDFINNSCHVNMQPNQPISSNLYDNVSFFDNCLFKTDVNSLQTTIKNNLVFLNGVKRVKFHGCRFDYPNRVPSNNPGWEDSLIAIRGINASVIAKGTADNGASVGYFTLNMDYGIFLVNPIWGNIIQDLTTGGIMCSNGIYISGGYMDKIVRNNFNLSLNPNSYPTKTGIYLDNCNYYKIENNSFYSYVKPNSYGVIVNNSGPYANKIYNNNFVQLDQGIWCQNQNYNPVTGDGLILNCNDFTNVDYNIGVQKDFVPSNNTGIGEFQAIPGLNFDNHTRNKYNTTSCSNENKYYSFTPFDLPPQVQHPNFNSSAFKVGPQPACSDGNEVNDVSGINIGATPKSVYCPNTSNLPFQKINHTAQIGILSNQITTLTAFYNNNLDGGNTLNLLNVVNSNTSPGQIKNQLLAATFLSDTVLTTYFKKANTPAGHAQQVHEKNAPVSRKVWQTLVAQNYPNGIFNQMQAAQNAPILSARENTLGTLQLAKNNRSYEVMHKSMALLNDTVGTIKDSLAQLIVLNNQGDVPRQLIELDVNFNNYALAREKITSYMKATNTADKIQYGEFMLLYCNLMLSTGLEGLKDNAALKLQVETVYKNPTHPCQYKARNIMNAVFNAPFEVQKLKPIQNAARLMQVKQSGDENAFNNLVADLLTIYPNPASSNCNVNNQSTENLNLKVISINGQLLFEQTIAANSQTELNTTILQNGIYVVTLINQKGQSIKNQKLVIVK